MRMQNGRLIICPIVGYNGVVESEATYDVLPKNLIICWPMTSESGTTLTYLVK